MKLFNLTLTHCVLRRRSLTRHQENDNRNCPIDEHGHLDTDFVMHNGITIRRVSSLLLLHVSSTSEVDANTNLPRIDPSGSTEIVSELSTRAILGSICRANVRIRSRVSPSGSLEDSHASRQ